MHRLLPLLLIGLSTPGFAQVDFSPTCPGGTVIELDGEIICEKQDSLALLITDFEAAELAGDVYRLGQEGGREALKQLPNISPEAVALQQAATPFFPSAKSVASTAQTSPSWLQERPQTYRVA